jgi:hypothetical protein
MWAGGSKVLFQMCSQAFANYPNFCIKILINMLGLCLFLLNTIYVFIVDNSANAKGTVTDRQMDGQTDGLMDRQMDGLMDGQTDGRTDGQMGRWTD